MDDLATIAVQLLQDAINLSPAEESDGESLSQLVFIALTPSEQQLSVLRNEYSKVSFYTQSHFFCLVRFGGMSCGFGRAMLFILARRECGKKNRRAKRVDN